MPREDTSDDPTQNACKLSDVDIGKPDCRGRVIQEIYWRLDDFAVYKADERISAHFSDDPKQADDQKQRYFAMSEGIAEFNHLVDALQPLWRFLTFRGGRQTNRLSRSRTLYEREMGRCLAQALTGDVTGAQSSLQHLHKRVEARVSNRARILHFVVNLILVSVVVLLTTSYFITQRPDCDCIDFNEIAVALMMGSVGALFSTTARLKEMEVDATVGFNMHLVYAVSRVLVGSLAAVILYLGFRSGIVTEFFQPFVTDDTTREAAAAGDAANGAGDADNGNGANGSGRIQPFDFYWLSFVSVLAGFSERLVPNLLDSKATSALDGMTPAEERPTEATGAPGGTARNVGGGAGDGGGDDNGGGAPDAPDTGGGDTGGAEGNKNRP
ncbi:MAG: hypothetical protein QNJ16_00280 [Rhodobacter sp.]|nr:hypothetical protein [Rhodobacter sp.]